MFPLFFFIAFAGGLSGVQNAPDFDFKSGYTSFQFAFVCIQSAAFGGVFTGFAIAADFEFGFARRLLLAAPNRGGIVVGYMLSAMVRWLFVLAVVFRAGLVSGMRVDGSLGDLLGAARAGARRQRDVDAVGGRHRDAPAHRCRPGPVMQMPVFILLFLAPVYVPLNLVAGWVHDVATLQPVHGAAGGRARLHLRRAGRRSRSAPPASPRCSRSPSLWARGGLRSAERAG